MNTMTLPAAGAPSAGPISDKTRAAPPKAPPVGPDDPEIFLGLVLNCFPLARRAVLLLLGGVAAFDVCGVLAEGIEPDGPGSAPDMRANVALWAGLGAAVLALAAATLLASIQVRYTFEHAETRRRHFYELKLARFREACAELKSLAVKEAVGAVRTLHVLRREMGGLDRRLAIETLTLKRRMRDLVWGARAGVLGATGGALAVVAATGRGGLWATGVPILVILGSLVAYATVELWMRERMTHVVELLEPAPREVAQAFDPSPHLEAAVERLLTRLNRHFDRLKGAAENLDEESELFS